MVVDAILNAIKSLILHLIDLLPSIPLFPDTLMEYIDSIFTYLIDGVKIFKFFTFSVVFDGCIIVLLGVVAFRAGFSVWRFIKTNFL